MVDRATEKINQAIREQFKEIKDEIRARDDKRDDDIAMLKKEIYGEGNTKGLRTDVSDLQRNMGIAHTLQVAIAAAFASLAKWT